MPDKIVVLDGDTLNPGDLDWSPLEALGKLTVHPRTSTGNVVATVGDAPFVLTNKTVLDAATIEKLPSLRYIGVLATGVNVVDLQAARKRGVPVTNVPGYSTDSVAQQAFALLLELTNQVGSHSDAVRDGDWEKCDDFSFTLSPIIELAGKTLGIVGMGAIGKAMSRIGAAMGMKIAAAHQRSMKSVSLPGIDITWLPLEELLATADVVSLHCPLTDATKHMINADRLKLMKPAAYLLNTGRGPLLDEAAVDEALRQGRLAGAGLDVLSAEPPAGTPRNPLVGAPNCVITPHVAWASVEARRRLMQRVAENVAAFQSGQAINVVN